MVNFSKRHIPDIEKYEHDELLDAKRVIGALDRHTSFGELVTSFRTSRFNLKPTWGVSKLRDIVTVSGTGAAVIEENGEYKLSTGTTATGYAHISTSERGQYQAGTEGEIGIGIRLPANPTGTQFSEWGYFDTTNGFGYGVDSTGVYIFRLSGGTKTKVYQNNWNVDKLDGTNNLNTNPSGLTLNLASGNIFQINFVWYGYGNINFYLNIKKISDLTENRILVHTIQINESASVIDPNQPLTVNIDNGATSDTNLDIYVGGRQFSVVDGISDPKTRNTVSSIIGQTLSSTTYVPFLAVRKKANIRGRVNSLNCIFTNLDVTTTNNSIDWYLSFGDTTDGTWGAIPETNSDETGLEMKTNATAAGTTQYRKFLAGTVQTGNTKSITQSGQSRLTLGQEVEIVFWAKKKTGSDAVVDLFLNFEEEW